MIPSAKERLKEANAWSKAQQENQQLQADNEILQERLEEERRFSARLLEGVASAFDFLENHLPEQLRPLVQKAREFIPVPDGRRQEREQGRGHTWGRMEL